MSRKPDRHPASAPFDIAPGIPAAVRGVVRDLPVAAAILDLDGRAWFWNAAAEVLFPPPPQSAAAAYPLFSLGTQSWFKAAQLAATQGRSTGALLWRLRGVGGTRHRLGVSIAPLRDDNKAVVALLAMLQDTTARDRAYRRSWRRTRWYTAVLDHLSDPVIVHRDGGILYANTAALDLFGFSERNELVGHSLDDSITVTSGGRVSEQLMPAEVVIRRGTDATCEAVLVPTPMTFRNRRAIAVTLRDVRSAGSAADSASRDRNGNRIKGRTGEENGTHSEEQVRQAQRMEAIGRLAGGISHDFNNLLTAIQGHVQFLIDDLPNGSPSLEDAVEIKKSADRAAGLTRQLLTFSRKQELQPRVVDLNVIITEMGNLFRRVINEDIQLQTTLEPELWPVRADPGQIEQVLVNLVVNARDALPRGGSVTIRTANVELDDAYAVKKLDVGAGPYVVLSVSDTGVGMDRETKSHVFEPFFTTKEPGKGTGLGLATVYGIVKQSGGHVWVYSEPNHGTTFKIYLPSVAESQDMLERGSKLADRAHDGETILLIEDEPAVRNLARRVLESRGYAVLEAGCGKDAIRIATDRTEPIHLVLSDVVMPDMNGGLIAKQLHEFRPDLKLLFMSGYTDEDVKLQGIMEAGMPFIEKPFTPDLLAKKVREVLDA